MPTPLLSAKLIELRQHFNLSQQDVADYLGLTREAYSHYERSAREPSLETLVKLSKLYQIDISDLINENTILPSDTSIQDMSLVGIPCTEDIRFHSSHLIPSTITNNLIHFLKLFTGKNTNLDLTMVSKDDIRLLADYKKLSNSDQKEVQQFIRFKLSLSKQKE